MAHDRKGQQRLRTARNPLPPTRAITAIVFTDIAVTILAPWLIHPRSKALGALAIILALSVVCVTVLVIAWRRTRPPRGH
jgi:NADH:ubiquinone oxidoreductase subunit 3 (subunit A)